MDIEDVNVTDEIITVKDLHVDWGGREVISGLSFSLKKGDVLAVIGPNGSGKTTLLKTILGIKTARSGSLRIFGKKRIAPDEAERLISYIPQRLEIDRTFPISLREMLGLNARAKDAERYLEILELKGLLSHRVGDLSGGEMQRALLAYAISKEPSLLVMDEPTSWVDIKGSDCVLCIMEEFKRKGIAMVIVSHDFSELRYLSTHVLGLGPGAHFYEPVDSPLLDEKIKYLIGVAHAGHATHCSRVAR